MKVLLTGGTGFIGRALSVKLSTMGIQVLCLVRDLKKALWMKNHRGLEAVQGDIENQSSIVPYVGDIDAVFHLAGLTKGKNRDEYLRINGEGTGNLLDAVLSGGKRVRKFLYVSSLAVAGPHTSENPARENGVISPITHYGESKLQGESLVREKLKDIPWTIVRPPVVYGPFDRDVFVYFKMAKSGIIPMLGKGGMDLSIIHVDDVTDGMILAGFTGKSDGEIYYLSDGRVHRIEEVFKLLTKVTGGGRIIPIPPFLGKVAGISGDLFAKISGKAKLINSQKVKEALQEGWVCNIDKIKEKLGFVPNIEIEEGLNSTYCWYRDVGWL